MKTNTLNLENYGVQKMSEKEEKETEGGAFRIALFDFSPMSVSQGR